MLQWVMRFTDVVATMGVLGLILRYGPEAAGLIKVGGEQLTSFYKQVALIDVGPQGGRV